MIQIHFLVFHAETEEEAKNKLEELVSTWQENTNTSVYVLGLLREDGHIVFDKGLPQEIVEGRIQEINRIITNEIKMTGNLESETGQGFRRVCEGSRDMKDLLLASLFCEELLDLAEMGETEGDFDVLTHRFRDYRFNRTGVSSILIHKDTPRWIGVLEGAFYKV